MDEDDSSAPAISHSSRSTSVSHVGETVMGTSKRRRRTSEVSLASSGSAYSAMTRPPPPCEIPDYHESYRTKGRFIEIAKENSLMRIDETNKIVSEIEWVRIDRCRESDILRKTKDHHEDVIDWIVRDRPSPESMILSGFKDECGNVAILDGNARVIGMRKENRIALSTRSANVYDEVCVRLVKSDSIKESALSVLKRDRSSEYSMSEKLDHLSMSYDVLSIDKTMNYQEVSKLLNQVLPEEVYSIRLVRLSLCPDHILQECCKLLENKDLGFNTLDIFHTASAVNSAESEDALNAFIRDKDTHSFSNECRHIASSVGSYLRSLQCSYDLSESRYIEDKVKEIPYAMNYLRSSLRAQRWKKKKSPECVIQSIEELWTKESELAREKSGLTVEIIEDIGDVDHDIYIFPMKIVHSRMDKKRNPSSYLSVEDADRVRNGIILLVDGESCELSGYGGEEVFLLIKDIETKGHLKRNFISNSITLNKRETVQYLDSKGFKSINPYEMFAAAFKSFTLFVGTSSSAALEFIGTYFRLVKKITVDDAENKTVIENEMKNLKWAIK